jgi:hypothetical protein
VARSTSRGSVPSVRRKTQPRNPAGTGAPDELDAASELDDADAAGAGAVDDADGASALALGAGVKPLRGLPLAVSLARTCAASVADW